MEACFERDGLKITYKTIRSKRKSIVLKMSFDKLLLIYVPNFFKNKQVVSLILDKLSWIKSTLEYFDRIAVEYGLNKKHADSIFYLGREYRICKNLSIKNKVYLSGDFIFVNLNPRSKKENVLNSFFKQKMFLVFNYRLKQCLKLFDYNDLEIKLEFRKMKRRWGSYITKSNIIKLNSKLIGASTRLIDAVIIHELCHVKYKNHKKEFYDFLESKLPEHKKIDKELIAFSFLS